MFEAPFNRLALQQALGYPLPDFVSGLADDSRLVASGDAFIWLNSSKPKHIQHAIDQGAVVVIGEPSIEIDIPYIEVPNLNAKRLGLYQSAYQTHRLAFPIMGVTGTNGKSSIVHFLSYLLSECYEKLGVLGTLGNGIINPLQGNKIIDSELTTQGLLSMHRWMGIFHTSAVQAALLEVSSHGIDQNRIEGLGFSVKVLTNVTQDHLDYHGSFEAYRAVKMRFFKPSPSCTFVLNIDDALGCELAQSSRCNQQPHLTYSLSCADADFYVNHIKLIDTGYRFCLHALGQPHWVTLNVKGEFQMANLLACIATAHALGIPLMNIIHLIETLKPAQGRLERLNTASEIDVYVDFAHTPDALESVLHALRKVTKREIICIFGCGGDRDQSKRARMGRISATLADHTIITDDNPRTESPACIRADIKRGAPQAIEVDDRKAAIAYGINMAKAGDVVLIAGKGHEQYQIIGHEKTRFSDHQFALEVLKQRAD